MGRVDHFGDVEDSQSEQFLDPVEHATYVVALTVAYPAIKIADQTAASFGGVARAVVDVTQLVVNPARMR